MRTPLVRPSFLIYRLIEKERDGRSVEAIDRAIL